MLRSLDPEKNFEAPKSKKFHPTKDEVSKFDEEELSYVNRGTKLDEELRVKRHIRDAQNRAVLDSLTKGGKDAKTTD